LLPPFGNFTGKAYFCDQCSHIKVDDVIEKVKNRILYRLNNRAENNLGSEARVYAQCPSDNFPEKDKNGKEIKKPKIELFAFKLAFTDGLPTDEQINTAILFGVEQELNRQQLCINTVRSNVTHIDFNDGSITICCPKLPKDTDARIGVRRNPKNPDKIEKIFGYNLVLTTSVELHLKIELPVAVANIAGNVEEGSLIIHNKQQIEHHHSPTAVQTNLDIADSKYDIIDNYHYIRKSGSIPIIDYNPRNENLSKHALLQRGYDQNGPALLNAALAALLRRIQQGEPFAPCGLLCRSNGFDQKHQRLTFCCYKQCMNLGPKALDELQRQYNIARCPHIHNKTGFAKHMYVKEHPRLLNEIPRGSKRYKDIKKIRSASERANSTLKENTKILDKPRVLNATRANILAQMAAIVLLLSRGFSFIVRTTCLIRKLLQSKDSSVRKDLMPHIPKSILRLLKIQLE